MYRIAIALALAVLNEKLAIIAGVVMGVEYIINKFNKEADLNFGSKKPSGNCVKAIMKRGGNEVGRVERKKNWIEEKARAKLVEWRIK
jgi:hypothetical protein